MCNRIAVFKVKRPQCNNGIIVSSGSIRSELEQNKTVNDTRWDLLHHSLQYSVNHTHFSSENRTGHIRKPVLMRKHQKTHNIWSRSNYIQNLRIHFRKHKSNINNSDRTLGSFSDPFQKRHISYLLKHFSVHGRCLSF